jgi:hypothetical protein
VVRAVEGVVPLQVQEAAAAAAARLRHGSGWVGCFACLPASGCLAWVGGFRSCGLWGPRSGFKVGVGLVVLVTSMLEYKLQSAGRGSFVHTTVDTVPYTVTAGPWTMGCVASC